MRVQPRRPGALRPEMRKSGKRARSSLPDAFTYRKRRRTSSLTTAADCRRGACEFEAQGRVLAAMIPTIGVARRHGRP